MGLVVLLGTFFVLLLLNVPVSFTMGISVLLYLFLEGMDPLLLTQRMFAGCDSFSMVAVPLFIFAGEIMNRCGVTRRIFNFATELIGFIPGGLAHVNVLASTMFAGISGSTSADVASLGVMEIAGMEEAGYDRTFSTAITCASATIGSIIPPSILMVLYSSITGISCGKLFIAGFLPGIFVAASQMVYCFIRARQNPVKYDGNVKPSFNGKRLLKATVDVIPAMLMPAIIIVGTMTGAFTATEAGAVAGVYGVLIGIFLYHEFKLRDMVEVMLEAGKMTGMSMMIFATATAFSYCLSIERLPAKLGNLISGISSDPNIVMLLMILCMLVVGCFMDTSCAAVIMVPIFQPIAAMYGIDPIHFGMVMVMTFIMGGITPPVGMTLFIASAVGKIPLTQLIKEMWPLIALFGATILVVAYFPALSLFLPGMLAA